jgi:NAD(P)-dependent dehydrogenase (short-subunit alcohol dehydrogenase family)
VPSTTIEGNIALVTGAGSGIGLATALALASQGATVICADINAAAAEKAAAECSEQGATSEAVVVDVASRPAVADMAERVEHEIGPVGILVNNAGVGMSGRFTDMSLEDWNWIRSINLDGVVHGCAVFGPRMLDRRRGHVVNISSGLGYTPTASESGYVTTKAAVLALSQCLRADWARDGIGVSAICPGVINTPIIDHTRFLGGDGTQRHDLAARAFRRGHRPASVAKAVVGAIEHNRGMVTVGIEASLGWYLHRFMPLAVQQAMARAGTWREPKSAKPGKFGKEI